MKAEPIKWERWYVGSVPALLLCFAMLQLCIALFTDNLSLSFDESIWQYIGRNWFRHGLVPYRGGIDNKSPLIFAVFGLSDWLFGVNDWFPKLMGTAVQSIGIFYLYKIAHRLAGRRAGIWTMTIYGLSLLWHGAGGKYVSYTETYAVTAVIISFYLFFTAGRVAGFVTCGFFAFLAIASRLTGIFAFFALLAAAVAGRPKKLPAILLGLICGVVLFLLLAWICGIRWTDIYQFAFADNFGQGSPTDHDFSWKMQNFFNKFFYSEFMLFIPFLTAYFFLPNKSWPVLFWFAASFIGIHVVGIYSTQHFKEILPPLSLIAAILTDHCQQVYSLSLKKLTILLWVSFFPKTLEPLRGIKRWLGGPANLAKQLRNSPDELPDELVKKQLGLWIRSQTTERDQLLVAGYGAVVQAYSERISPTAYFNETATIRARGRVAADLSAARPAMVAIPAAGLYQKSVNADTRRAIDSLIGTDYFLERNIFGYAIYRVKK